jgi:putative pyruvate formate lyase activating enzyme
MPSFPSYLSLLESGELERRVEALVALLAECRVCPRNCRSKRLQGGRGACETGRLAEVASWCVHRGEEPCISGSRGSGTVFFAHCNLKCLFCQNYQISQEWAQGEGAVTAARLAEVYLELQAAGAHNINWVSPSHVVPQATEALLLAAHRGLNIPVVYNSNGYDSLEVLRLLDGVVDVYMPDLKYGDDASADELSRALGYVPNAHAALAEMWRQVGRLELDEGGVALRGLLVRHLVLPNGLSGAGEVLRFLATELSPDVSVSLMAQYYPRFKAMEHPLLARKVGRGEYARAVQTLEELGFTQGYVQDHCAAENYLPDFDAEGHPFEGT